MRSFQGRLRFLSVPALWLPALLPDMGWAHDPVFGLGPHTLFQGGVELHAGFHQAEQGDKRHQEAELAVKYGLTGDWVVGVEVPYSLREGSTRRTERGSTALTTKYRFWRKDTFARQQSAAVLLKAVLHDADNAQPGTDYLAGLTYGDEGRKWYRWVSLRHRSNADQGGLERPDLWRLDAVIGIRFEPTAYLEPDWVWMLELNGERREATNRGTAKLGGDQWFLSPGLMWTYRNFAVKTGVQLPIADDLRGNESQDDYRALVELEWHL